MTDINNPSIPKSYMSEVQIYLLALASAVVTANAYYIHPIIAPVADHFAVSDALIGIVPAMNQLALALGIFLLLPLGDRFSNRRLTIIFVIGQTASLAVMTVSQTFWMFVAGSTVLGVFTIAPYLIPAYASKRVLPNRLGQVTAILTTGIIVGILFARTGAGVVGEYFGWRAVYVIATLLMTAIAFLLPMIMDKERVSTPSTDQSSYPALVLSTFSVVAKFPEVLLSGAIQALSFGIFLSVWMGLGLHLTSPDMGFGVDTVGYLSAISAINILATPRLGAWADRTGARKARVRLAVLQLLGVSSLLFFGHSLWLLVIPLLVMNLTGPMVDVTGRMTFLDQAPDIRTRLMTVYIVMMFTGGGLASWAGTAVYDFGGWTGNAVLAITLSLCALILSIVAERHHNRRAASSS